MKSLQKERPSYRENPEPPPRAKSKTEVVDFSTPRLANNKPATISVEIGREETADSGSQSVFGRQQPTRNQTWNASSNNVTPVPSTNGLDKTVTHHKDKEKFLKNSHDIGKKLQSPTKVPSEVMPPVLATSRSAEEPPRAQSVKITNPPQPIAQNPVFETRDLDLVATRQVVATLTPPPETSGVVRPTSAFARPQDQPPADTPKFSAYIPSSRIVKQTATATGPTKSTLSSSPPSQKVGATPRRIPPIPTSRSSKESTRKRGKLSAEDPDGMMDSMYRDGNSPYSNSFAELTGESETQSTSVTIMHTMLSSQRGAFFFNYSESLCRIVAAGIHAVQEGYGFRRREADCSRRSRGRLFGPNCKPRLDITQSRESSMRRQDSYWCVAK
jgi:hypothetical protein